MAGLHLAAGEHCGPAEKVSLKIVEPLLDCGCELHLVFHSFCDEGRGAPAEHGECPFAGVFIGSPKVHFDVIGQLDEGADSVAQENVAEGQPITSLLEREARGNDFLVRLHGLQYLEHGMPGGQQRSQVADQSIAGALHKDQGVG